MINLRPYQLECVASCERHWAQGDKRLLASLATGLGKTVVFSEIARRRTQAKRRIQGHPHSPILILAHLQELLEQAKEKLSFVAPDLKSSIIEKGRIDPEASVNLISVQSAATAKTLQALREIDHDLVIVDEAHHAVADEYQEVLRGLGCLGGTTKLLGVTATPFRTDDRDLDDIFEKTVYKKGILEGIVEGYLADLRGLEVPIDCDLGQSNGKDYDSGKLGRLLRGVLPQVVLDTVLRYAPNRKIIVFVPTVEVAREVAAYLADNGFAADHVSGQDSPTDRRDKILAYQQGRTRILVNAMLLTEGFDDPETDCVIIARPTKSKGLYLQMAGRGLRLYPGKNDCLIVDLVPRGHKSPTLTLSELARVTPEEARERGMRSIYKKRAQAQAHSNANPTWGDGRERNLFAELNWSRFDGDVYGIQVEKTSVVLYPVPGFEQSQRLYDVYVEGPENKNFLHQSIPLPYAQGVAEDLIRERNALKLTTAQADWRNKPATDAQLETLQRNQLPFRTDMTRGEAGDLIQQSKLSRVIQSLRRKGAQQAA